MVFLILILLPGIFALYKLDSKMIGVFLWAIRVWIAVTTAVGSIYLASDDLRQKSIERCEDDADAAEDCVDTTHTRLLAAGFAVLGVMFTIFLIIERLLSWYLRTLVDAEAAEWNALADNIPENSLDRFEEDVEQAS